LSDINAKLSGNRKTLITWLVIYLLGILNQHSATITVYNQKLIRKKTSQCSTTKGGGKPSRNMRGFCL